MILITGATGFLGKYIVKDLLEAGYELRLLVRNAGERKLPWHGLVDIVEGDVTDIVSLEKAVKGVDTLIHAAAVVSYWKKRAREMTKVNVIGTANVVNACLEYGVKRLIHISSIAATGKESELIPITEDAPWLPSKHHSRYAISKHKAEYEIHRGVAEGLEAVMLNPGVIIGAGDWELGTPKLFSLVDKGLKFYNRGLIGAVGAEDVARVTNLMLEQEIYPGERFILVSENMSQKDFFAQIAKSIHRQAPKWQLPAFVSLLVGYISQALAALTRKEPIISVESMRSSISRYRYDASKVESLGFTYTSMDEVIAETGRLYLNERMRK